jgi:small basic protein (TIGR04137 family)
VNGLGEIAQVAQISRWHPSVVSVTNALRSDERQRFFEYRLNFMSQHRSLRAAATTGAKRNVLKRFERVELLKKRNQWKPGDRVMGLRKTKPEA